MIEFKKAKDRSGAYSIDWSRMRDMQVPDAPNRVMRIPFCAGDGRVMSTPAQEAMFTGVGSGTALTHAVFALRLGEFSVHQAFSPAGMRQLAKSLVDMADLIEGSGQ